MFTQPFECQYCRELRQLTEELAEVSEQVTVEVYGFRVYGIPAGYEFTSLLPAIRSVSAAKADLVEETVGFLQTLEQPLLSRFSSRPLAPTARRPWCWATRWPSLARWQGQTW